jgi:16S rRNA (guanine1207-N2)-methyltransferase
VFTKPGFSNWESVSPASELLLEAAGPERGAAFRRAALFGCGSGALAVALARQAPAARIDLIDISTVALDMAERTLRANGVQTATVCRAITLLPEQAGQMDMMLIDLPQGRALARRWLVEAAQLLRPGGRLILAGRNELGIQSVADDARALFGAANMFGYRRKCRAFVVPRQEVMPAAPEWASLPGIAPSTWHSVVAELAGAPRELASLPGTFSYERLDAGTALLLRAMPDAAGQKVADAGCGYGPLGLAAALGGAARVVMTDASTLAAAAAEENIRRLDLAATTTILAGDALAPLAGQRFDMLLSNPPFHAGKRVSYDVAELFVRQGRELIKPGGRLVIVANRFIRYDYLVREVFGQVEVLAHDRSYHVLAGLRHE